VLGINESMSCRIDHLERVTTGYMLDKELVNIVRSNGVELLVRRHYFFGTLDKVPRCSMLLSVVWNRLTSLNPLQNCYLAHMYSTTSYVLSNSPTHFTNKIAYTSTEGWHEGITIL
jgi:hypothetical protein